MIHRILSVGGLVLLVSALGGCGDEEQMPPPPPPEPPSSNPGASHGEESEEPGELTVNERWDTIKVYFLGLENDLGTGYVRGTVGTVRDPFEPQLVKFVPRIVETEDEDVAADLGPAEPSPVVTAEPSPVAQGETQKFRSQDYRIVLIRWGTSVNKAVVEDPEGSTYIINEDMKLGNNNGQVVGITRYEVTIREPNREEPIVLSIQPPILGIHETDGTSERLFTNQTPKP